MRIVFDVGGGLCDLIIKGVCDGLCGFLCCEDGFCVGVFVESLGVDYIVCD